MAAWSVEPSAGGRIPGQVRLRMFSVLLTELVRGRIVPPTCLTRSSHCALVSCGTSVWVSSQPRSSSCQLIQSG